MSHSADLLVPEGSQLSEGNNESEDKLSTEEDCNIADTVVVGRNPYYPNQRALSDLIRDLGLVKSNGEPLVLRLKEWDLLDDSVVVCSQRKRHKHFSNFFANEDRLCYCSDVSGLLDTIGIYCNADEWKRFIDGSS